LNNCFLFSVHDSEKKSDPGPVFIHFNFENHDPINPDHFLDRDRHRDCNSEIGIRFENENR